ncbi:MAG: cache domain-containing protein [Acidobacteriaceae bacterium]|nr:cache domain-containing protein [Acidobacteriaceae bacterium]
MDRLEVRVSITKLLLGLIVVIVPLSVIGLLLTERSDKALDNSVGTDFKVIAQQLGNQVSQGMRNRVAAVNAIAVDPAVVSAVSAEAKAGNATAGAGKKEGGGMLGSSLSQLLRERKTLNPEFLSLVVTDQNGNVIAATQQPPKASYAQDAGWQAVYNNGQGVSKVSDILDDEFTKSSYVNIGVPVKDPGSAATIGVVNGAVNINDILSPFREAQIGNGARAELVSDDGTIVSGPNADAFSHLKSPHFDALRDSLGGGLHGTQSGWLRANLQNGPHLVAYSGTGLKQHFSNLGWVVLVSQDEHIAAAPVRGLERFALAMVILALFMLTLLFVYYYLHRKQEFEDIEHRMRADQLRPAGEETRSSGDETRPATAH